MFNCASVEVRLRRTYVTPAIAKCGLGASENHFHRQTAGGRQMSTLYLTYDGLTTTIGQSQVLPYLLALVEDGFPLSIVSFEQEARTSRQRRQLESKFCGLPVVWDARHFRTKPPLLAKYVDQTDMILTALMRANDPRIRAIHSRSYIAGFAGMLAKRRTGKPHIFDMRGFWADQRLEGGRWPSQNPFYRRLYKTWKKREARMIETADTVIVLTEAAKVEIEKWPCYRGADIAVIPCSVDYRTFEVATANRRLDARAQLGIQANEKVLCYLGSLGTVYKLPEMLRYFSFFRAKFQRSRMLFIGKHEKSQLMRAARDAGANVSPDDVVVVSAANDEVSRLLAAADVAICFITPTFSSLGVSPTKLGEYLATGLPVIANAGIGDVTRIVNDGGVGHVLPTLTDAAFADSIQGLERLLEIPPDTIRSTSRRWHDFPLARERYTHVYERQLQRGHQAAVVSQ